MPSKRNRAELVVGISPKGPTSLALLRGIERSLNFDRDEFREVVILTSVRPSDLILGIRFIISALSPDLERAINRSPLTQRPISPWAASSG